MTLGMEILGIPFDNRKLEGKQTLETDPQLSKSSKKSVKDKLKETETFHHDTAASKSSHSKKKRRKSHAERNKKKSRHEKSNKMNFPMMSDPHKKVPLITQSRLTTSIGMYNRAKKSDKILRDFQMSDAVRATTQESLQKILDVSEANLPPAPKLDSPFVLDDMDVHVVKPASPQAIISASKPVAAIPSGMDQSKELPSQRDRTAGIDLTHDRNHITRIINSSPELSPVSEAAELMQSSFSLNSVFPGRDYFSEIKDSLVKQLQKQKQSSVLKTPRKSHKPTRRHSSVRKNLNTEFDRKSGSVQSSLVMSIERNLQHGDVVRRSDLIPKSISPSGIVESSKLHTTRGSLSSSSIAPHTITAPPSSSLTRVNAFEECTRTLQDQPHVDISVEEFFPRVETQMLPGEHNTDMLDYIQLSCSNNDSFSYPDPHHLPGNIIPVSSLIYPPHLDPTLPFQEMDRHGMPSRKRKDHPDLIRLQKGKYQPYVSGSDEDSPMLYTLPLPPPPVLPPGSPSPPQMFRHRMY